MGQISVNDVLLQPAVSGYDCQASVSK